MIRCFSILLLTALSLTLASNAATIPASSPSRADVASAVAAALIQ